MSCCGGKCGCGSKCKCGSQCKGCRMFPDLEFYEETTTQPTIAGVAPLKIHSSEMSEITFGAETGSSMIGSNFPYGLCTS